MNFAVIVLAVTTAAAQMPPPPDLNADMSCAYFSPDPKDTKGPPIQFFAMINADEESAVTESPGSGLAEFVLDRATLKFDWKVTFKDLTSAPVGLHVHGPQTPGGEAGILFDLAPKDQIKSGLTGSMTLNDGQLIYLINDRMYVNLHTTKYPAGELRGSIRKQRPKCGS
ncbi:MAG: CHRD domain-containing protein [Alphaproteobacteria bacterium]|nr:CHRD domain-containing protein [Alphaproteobacteria bacterium]